MNGRSTAQTDRPVAVNDEVASSLEQFAAILEAQQANRYRIEAYRRAASNIRDLDRGVDGLFTEKGMAGLDALPGIGPGIAGAIAEILSTGSWSQLERLRGSLDPATAFRMIPGVGPKLAAQIHNTLHVDTLEGLEQAAQAGRLETVPGVGKRRADAIKALLAGLLAHRRIRRRTAATVSAHQPAIAEVLDVDREYRAGAAAGTLRTIAPKRLNPKGQAWLPLLQTTRGDWHFTAMFSNTALAHQLGRTNDWVVIFFYDHDHVEHQCTVVTETRGSLEGQRVVRGREADCLDHYSSPPSNNRPDEIGYSTRSPSGGVRFF